MFNEKYGLKLGEFNNTTGTERVNGYSLSSDHMALIFEFELKQIINKVLLRMLDNQSDCLNSALRRD